MKRIFTKPLGKRVLHQGPWLGLFDLFKDVKDSVLLDEEDIVAEEEAGEEQEVEEQGNDANV